MVTGLPTGYRLRKYAVVRSTNAHALEAAGSGEEGGLWIIADRQTAGRGSRGRQWIGLEGNLFTSLLLVNVAAVSSHAELTFVVSLAVRDALAQLFCEQRLVRNISLKWPNDVLVDGAKISGILLESHEIGKRGVVIVGIGVNCRAHPPDLAMSATDLKSHGLDVDTDVVFEKLAHAVAKWLEIWDRGRNFSTIRREWLKSAAGRGGRLRVCLPNITHEGIFEDMDAAGRLILRTDTGDRIVVASAEIFFGEFHGAGTSV